MEPTPRFRFSRAAWERLIFIGLSALFWFLIKFSKDGYVAQARIAVDYTGFPVEDILVNQPAPVLELELEGNGYSLLRLWLRSSRSVTLDFQNLTTRFVPGKGVAWVPLEDVNAYRSQLPAEIQVTEVRPDTVYFAFDQRERKKVPLVVPDRPVFASGYGSRYGVRLEPDSIWVSGPEEALKDLTGWNTLPLQLEQVSASRNGKVNLATPPADIFLEVPETSWQLEVEPFTEMKIKVPVQVEHLPPGFQLELYPDEAEVVCTLPLSLAPRLAASEFRVAMDFLEFKALGFTARAPLHLNVYPNWVSSCRLRDGGVNALVRYP